MTPRILVLLLVPPAFGCNLQDKVPGLHAAPPPAPFSIDAAGAGEDQFLCGECPCPEPASGAGHHHRGRLPAAPAYEGPAARDNRADLPGPVTNQALSTLGDNLKLGRPPPRTAAADQVPGKSG
ncbi:MAG: hypothetical protein ACM3L8_06950, partial [Verrucomicrobiota bacterium]